MKLQRYDFGGRHGRRVVPVRPPSARRKTLLFRYGAVAAILLALVGLRKYAQSGPSPVDPDRAPVAAAGLSPDFASPKADIPSAAAPKGASLASAGLDFHAPFRHYPDPDTFTVDGHTLVADYAADSLIHARIGVYLDRYRPDAAVVLACDLKSGRMLGVGERADSVIARSPRLAFRAGFPAASLAKILTATAALESRGKDPLDSIPQLGSYHTLYRRQLKVVSEERATKVTLQEAFSKSVNPAFAVLGMSMGPSTLQKTALNLGFNRPYACIRPSHFQAPDSGYALAETSCGFTDKTTISPLHALAIARGIGDDGRVRYGAFARSLTDLTDGRELDLRPDAGTTFVSRANLAKLQTLMEATVRSGTARKGFHQVLRASHLAKLDAGGKTGSLDGLDPASVKDEEDSQAPDAAAPEATPSKGRYDWFIGYARLKDDPSEGIALSIMLVHGEYARVRSTVLAALLIRDWLAAEEKARKAATGPTAVTGRHPAPAGLARAGAHAADPARTGTF